MKKKAVGQTKYVLIFVLNSYFLFLTSGGITLGIEASGDLLRHWFETLQTQDRRVIKWHTLSDTCPIINE